LGGGPAPVLVVGGWPHDAVPGPLEEDPVQHTAHAECGDREHQGKHGGSVVSDPTLKDRIASEMRDALRAGEKIRLGALRMLSAAVTNREKELRHELSDDEVRDVAAREVKKRAESIEAFEGAGRRELAEKERAEREAIAGYAPELLSDQDVDALIDEAFAATGAASEKELGSVMGYLMGKAKGRVDGNVVQRKVRARLAGEP
jgi:uncharacterized protein YqeY